MNRSQRVVDIQPEQGFLDLGLAELFQARELIWSFTRRGLTLRYRQTLLGIAWVVLQPLFASGVLALVFGTFAGLSTNKGTPYLLTVYAGLLPWMLFSQSIQRAGGILVTDRSLITKTYMPRMVLPLSSVLAVCVDVTIALACFLPIAFAYGVAPTLNVLALPVLFLPLLALTIGASLICAALNVYYRDVQQTIPFVMQVVFFASPIAYGAERITGVWAPAMRANPLAGQIEAFRWALLGGESFPLELWGVSCVVSLVVLAIGVLGFRRVERSLADVI